MKREEVYKVIDTERDYQIEMTKNNDRPDMIDDLHLGDSLSAIEHILSEARKEWYKGSTPYQNSMDYIRKISGLCVQLGEKYGMPERKIKK